MLIQVQSVFGWLDYFVIIGFYIVYNEKCTKSCFIYSLKIDTYIYLSMGEKNVLRISLVNYST